MWGSIPLFLLVFATTCKICLGCVDALSLCTPPTGTVIKEILHFYNVFFETVDRALLQHGGDIVSQMFFLGVLRVSFRPALNCLLRRPARLKTRMKKKKSRTTSLLLGYTSVHLSCYLPFYYLARLLLCLDLKRLRRAFRSFSAAALVFSCTREDKSLFVRGG